MLFPLRLRAVPKSEVIGKQSAPVQLTIEKCGAQLYRGPNDLVYYIIFIRALLTLQLNQVDRLYSSAFWSR